MKYLSLNLIITFSETRISRFVVLAGIAALLTGSLTSCGEDDDFNPFTGDELIQPTGPKPSYAPNMDDQMWAVIEQFVAFGDPPLPTLTARQARMTHSVTDAVNTLLAKNNLSAPAPAVTTDQRVLPPNYTPGSAPDGVPVRIYTPTAAATGARPGIVYYHGGGWVIGSLEVYEPSAQALAERTGAVVVSVDYRLASETMNKFPAAHEDAYAAYKWVRDSALPVLVSIPQGLRRPAKARAATWLPPYVCWLGIAVLPCPSISCWCIPWPITILTRPLTRNTPMPSR